MKKKLSDVMLRRIWYLRHVEKLDVRSIGELTGIPKSTVFDFLSGNTYKATYDELSKGDSSEEVTEDDCFCERSETRIVGESDPEFDFVREDYDSDNNKSDVDKSNIDKHLPVIKDMVDKIERYKKEGRYATGGCRGDKELLADVNDVKEIQVEIPKILSKETYGNKIWHPLSNKKPTSKNYYNDVGVLCKEDEEIEILGSPFTEDHDRKFNISDVEPSGVETFGEAVWSPLSNVSIEDIATEKKKEDVKKVLVIGDTHIPFCKEGYLEFCYRVYKEFNCNRVIHIGDCADFHSVSYHESDPNGHGGGYELSLVKDEIQKWNTYFPEMDVVIGNHDRLILRKAFSSGIPTEWIKSFNEVLGVNWNWKQEFFYDNVLYRHGVNTISSTSVLSEGCNIVQGHAHSVGRIIYKPGINNGLWGMQVGCGIDKESYAMQYSTSEPFLGCGVVLNNGKLPVVVRFGDI